jgi:redox-sensitive bicupin YhaK (pirin superfamily)
MKYIDLDLEAPTRRSMLGYLAATPTLWALGCGSSEATDVRREQAAETVRMDAVLAVENIGTQWPTEDPFLFCAYHLDAYPAANDAMGPDASLSGRRMGQDFANKDGWNMYHGRTIPGFPRHPHRGFETVTVVRRGLLDHADSMGATARYGNGDVQWLTAGAGIQHAEMFPLLNKDAANPLELFQIWLNLPAERKMVDPYFSMLWASEVPVVDVVDDLGQHTQLTAVAGGFDTATSPSPPPGSYASMADADVVIWTLAMEPGAAITLPARSKGSSRSVYFHRGSELYVDGHRLTAMQRAVTRGDAPVVLMAGDRGADVLVLGGRPIREPIARRGPFVMNTDAEIQQAVVDYRRTGFGGWPWPSDDHVHGWEKVRFAKRPDGTIERPG